MRSPLILGVCIALLLTCSLAADTRFTGAVSDLWSNPDNWNNGLPDADDKVQIEGGALCVLDYDAGVIKHTALEGGNTTHLRLVDGAQVSVRDWSIIGYAGAPEEPHLLEVLGGVYNANARMFRRREYGWQGHRGAPRRLIESLVKFRTPVAFPRRCQLNGQHGFLRWGDDAGVH